MKIHVPLRLWNLPVFILVIMLFAGCTVIRVQPIIDTPTPVTPSATVVPSQTPVPTNTIVWFPATATPRPFRTAVPQPTENLLPELGGEILTDTFASEQTWQTYRSAMGNAVMSNHELTLAIQDSNSAIASYSSLPQLGNYYLSVNVSLSLCSDPSDWYGIAFRVNDSENKYQWRFNCLGENRVERVYKGRVYMMSDWDINGVIKPYAPQKFSIGIAAEGGILRFYANDTLLKTVEDSLFESGGYGFLASSNGNAPLTVSFSEFKLSTIR